MVSILLSTHFLWSAVKNMDNSNFVAYILQSCFILEHANTCLSTYIMRCLGRFINLKFQELVIDNNFEFKTQNYTVLIFVFMNISVYIVC